MTIQTLYRVQCRCERYLGDSRPAVTQSSASPLFLTFSSAYDEAVRRGWSNYPLRCPDCSEDEVRNGKVRDHGNTPEDRR